MANCPYSLRLAVLLVTSLSAGLAATDVQVSFTLNTTDSYGDPIQQRRYYWVYQPDGLSKTTPVPMVLVMDNAPATFLHRKADQAGFVVVSCSFNGNSSGNPATVWINDDPSIAGYQDYDYTDQVIGRVRASDNIGDVFISGLSKGGHMALAYACVKPSMIKASATLDEFMGLTSNIPSAPVPVIAFEGTSDTNVPYTMVKDTIAAWRAMDNLLNVVPVTTYEPSPLMPGNVSQTTWRGGANGPQVAFVTIVGGTHTYPTPAVETGYDYTDGMWAFFSQFLSGAQASPRIVAQPVNNVQYAGQPATFRVTALASTPVSYQWQKDGADILGATGDWLTLPAVSATDDGATFRAVVSTDAGQVASDLAWLTVKRPPTGPAITLNPASQTVAAGQAVSFTVAATGGALRYQWKKNGVNIPGATDASLSIPAATSADCGATLSVEVHDDGGKSTSPRATLAVMPAPGAPVILGNPERWRALVGQQASFSVIAWSALPMTYQWQKGSITGNMADIPGATSSTYTFSQPTLADHLTLMRCVVSNAAGSAISASEMLFVTAAAAAPNQITSHIQAAAQTGDSFRFAITSSGGTAPLTYSAAPLPDGLSFDAGSGIIAGSASAAGSYAITIGAGNIAGDVEMVLTLNVTDTAPPVSIVDWRAAHFGASAYNAAIAGDDADPDEDGYSNLQEYLAGSDPLDASSVPDAVNAAPSAQNRAKRGRGRASTDGGHPRGPHAQPLTLSVPAHVVAAVIYAGAHN